MPKPYTFPILLDKLLQLEISKLNNWGYICFDKIKEGKIYWRTNQQILFTISIKSCINHKNPFIEISYKFNSNFYYYQIQLETTLSNLGKGYIWYFLCPITKKRCRKLYFFNGYFLSRFTIQNSLYYCQTLSKKQSGFKKFISGVLNIDSIDMELNKKHLKKTYAGKPTKKYIKLTTKYIETEQYLRKKIRQLI